MKIPRRTFLAASSGSVLGMVGLDLAAARARADTAVVRRGKLTTTVCPYCAVGCGAIVTASAGKVLSVEGDPDHPVNRGALCPKGTAMLPVANSDRRLTKVLYRAPGAAEWQEKDWDWAVAQIAQRIRTTRDATFRKTDGEGRPMHRTEAIGCLGGAALENEVCYAYAKLARALGIVFLEHQARVCHSSTVAALAPTFGRGAMTNHWNDLANADCLLVIGANPAENHPIAFRWITAATDRGATLLVVDPRYTRSAATAHVYAPIRAGTDVAFIGGLIRYALDRKLARRDYLLDHTNAAFLVDPQFAFDEGRFGRVAGGRYTREHWGFQRDDRGRLLKDPTLESPHCVLQLIRRHYERYTPEMVARVCGTPVERFIEVAEAFCSTASPRRSGTILYAMGATQHTVGTQYIRAYAILQLLLGNIGVAGGGINALRGESNVQGSTDHGLLFDLLPGYVKSPDVEDTSLAEYLRRRVPDGPEAAGRRKALGARLVSLLKAWWGEHATAETDFGFGWLPKRDGDFSYVAMMEAMHAGTLKGLFILGQNPAVSSPDVSRTREGLANLDWLVAADLWETETAAFWKRPGVRPEDIRTEVFLLPMAGALEKDGSVTNSGRWAQWRYPAVGPLGEARTDLWLLDRLTKHLKELYAAGGESAEPILKLTWEYGEGEEPSAEAVAREIAGGPIPSPDLLRDDGSTACGNWLYCGSFAGGENRLARRGAPEASGDPAGLHAAWAWSWPANRRVLYNRAGCDLAGKPWSAGKAVTAFDRDTGRWQGDLPDGSWAPGGEPDQGRGAFWLLEEGRAQLFAPSVADGPLAEHYEPIESPLVNPLSSQQHNPLVPPLPPEDLGDLSKYPIVATTIRVAEHWQSGTMSRNIPWLVELSPHAFVEISRELAAARGIRSGETVTVRSARGQIKLKALVTPRLKALDLAGRKVEQVALVWHFGYEGLVKGASANRLTPSARDPGALIPEYKAFLCEVEGGNEE